MTRRAGFLAVLAIAMVMNCAPARAGTSVLILHTYSQDAPVRQAIDVGIQKVLHSVGPNGVDTYFETIEIHKFPDAQYEQLMSEYLQRKYEHRPVDAIVVVFDTALSFLLRHRATLFPGVPIVALLTSHQSFDENANITAIWNGLPVGKTVAAALALRPETKRLVVVDAALASGDDVQRENANQLKAFGSQIVIDYLKDLPLDNVVDQVRALPPDAAVLFLRQLIGNGQDFISQRDALAAVIEASPVPVFVMSDQLVGTGVVGGVTFDSTGEGEQLGRTTLRVVRGIRARDIPSVEGPEIPMFDWRQLERWKLREAALPAGSQVLFRQATFWTSYGRYVIVAVSVCLLQTLLIVALLLERASRKRAERSLRDSEAALRTSAEHVRDLAGRLIAAQEDERRRIAIELHDDVSQGLALLSIELDQLDRTSTTSRSRSVRTSTIAARIADITSSVSALSIRLHPSRLEVLGLADAVQRLCHDVSSTHSIQIEFQNRALPPKIAPEVALCVYRIAQEALHNVTKHSGADRAFVHLSASENNLVLKVIDAGKGFDMRGPAAHGLGLLSIRDRVNFLNGRLDIQSAPGAGTQLATHIPIRTEALVASRSLALHH